MSQANNSNQLNIRQEIVDILKNYTNEIAQNVNSCTYETAKMLKKELRVTSPKLTTKYSKNWEIKEVKDPERIPTHGRMYVVYNKREYRLTHLLEYGHKINGGTGVVPPVPHIAPAADKAAKEYVKEIEKIIENGGK